MIFIKDVIYGLKQEYGELVIIKREKYENDLIRGQKTLISSSYQTIFLAIVLPLNVRQAFYKAINHQETFLLKSGEQQIAFDVDDFDWLPEINDYVINSKGDRLDIVSIENVSDQVLVITVKRI